MKAKKYNKGGKAALYDMVKKYAKGGKVGNDLTFLLKKNKDGGQDVVFMADGRPVTNKEAINYYASNMGPKEEFSEWFSNKTKGQLGSSQDVDKILAQIKAPGYKPGMKRSNAIGARNASGVGDLNSSQGGTEAMEGRSREDRAKKLLSGLADYRKPR